eukprot:15463988-Alexandrium_andersonii.AAC.1
MAKVGDPDSADPSTSGGAGGASCTWQGNRGGSATFADSELRRGLFGPFGRPGTAAPRAGCWAPSP